MACVGLDMAFYASTFALAANALDINGVAGFAGTLTGSGNISVASNFDFDTDVDFSGYTGTIIHDDAAANADTLATNGATLPALTINNGVTSFELQDALSCGDLTMTAGKFDYNGNAVTVDGDLKYGGGAYVNDATTTMTGTGHLEWNTASYELTDLVIALGAVVTTTASVFVDDKINIAGTLTGASSLIIFQTSTANWWTQTGTLSCHLKINKVTTAPGGDIVQTGAVGINVITDTASRTLTMTSRICTEGTLTVKSDTALTEMTLAMGSNEVRAAAIVLGDSNTTGGGILTGTGVMVLGSLTDGNAINDANSITLSTYTEGSGNFDFDNIAHAATADNVAHIVCTGTGVVNNFDPAEIVHVHGDATVDGGTNNAVNNKTTFNEHAPPGSLMTMGVGV